LRTAAGVLQEVARALQVPGHRGLRFAALPRHDNRNGKLYKHKLREQFPAASAIPSG
jgi:hypothetical protein